MIYIFNKGVNFGRYNSKPEIYWNKLFGASFVLQELKPDGSKWKLI